MQLVHRKKNQAFVLFSVDEQAHHYLTPARAPEGRAPRGPARPRPGGTRTQGACPPAPQRDAHPGGRCPCPGGARSQVHRLPAVGHGSDVPMSVPARAPEGRAPRGALPAPRRGALRRLPHRPPSAPRRGALRRLPHRPPSAPRGAVQCPPHARWHPGIVMHCPTTPIHGDHGNILHCRTLQRDPVDVT